MLLSQQAYWFTTRARAGFIMLAHHARPGSELQSPGLPVSIRSSGTICPYCFALHSLITCMSDNKNHRVLSPRCTQGPKIKHSALTFSFIPPWSPWTFRDAKGQRNKELVQHCGSNWCREPVQTVSAPDPDPPSCLASASSGSMPIPGGHRSAPVSLDASALDISKKRNPTLCAPLCLAPSPSPPVPQAPPLHSRWQHRVHVYRGHGLHVCATPSSIWTEKWFFFLSYDAFDEFPSEEGQRTVCR